MQNTPVQVTPVPIQGANIEQRLQRLELFERTHVYSGSHKRIPGFHERIVVSAVQRIYRIWETADKLVKNYELIQNYDVGGDKISQTEKFFRDGELLEQYEYDNYKKNDPTMGSTSYRVRQVK